MQAVLQQSKRSKHLLEWCLLWSIAIHLAIAFGIAKPQPKPAPPRKDEIRIQLVKQEAPTPPAPEPAKPEPTPPKPAPVKPLPKEIKPSPVPQKQMPVTPQPPQPVPPQPQPVAEPTPAVIAVKPTISENKPEVVVAPPPPPPPPEPPKATGPSEGDIQAALNALRSAAQQELKKYHRYPRLALERGVEGVAKLKISLDSHGNITDVEVLESSGNQMLDSSAIAAAKKAYLKPHFHEILKDRVDSIVVPFTFTIAR